MKNLPEKDFWNALKVRLGNYTEVPDDDGWDKIAGALPGTASSRWKGKVAGMMLVLTLGSAGGYFGYQYASQEKGMPILAQDAKSALLESAANERDEAVSDDGQQSSLSTAVDMDKNNNSGDQKSSALSSSPSSADQRELGNHTHKLDDQIKSSASDRGVIKKDDQEGIEGVDDKNDEHDFVNGSRSVTNTGHHGGTTPLRFPLKEGETARRSTEGSVVRGHAEVNEAGKEVGADVTTPLMVNVSSEDVTDTKVVGAQSKPGAESVTEASRPEELQPEKTTEKQSQLPVSGASVTSEKKEQKKKRIFHADVYFTLTPSLSFQKITPSGEDDIQVIGLVSEGTMSSERFGLSFEAGFQRKLSRNLEVYAGLSYYRQKQRLGYGYNSDEVTVDYAAGGGHTITPIPAVKEFDYNMTNAGVSAGAFYHLTGDLLMHKIGAGFQFQKGMLTSGSEGTYNNAKSYYFNYQLSYRLELKVSPKLNVYLQPTFIHSIIAHEELLEPFTIKPYRAGLGFGAIYHF